MQGGRVQHAAACAFARWNAGAWATIALAPRSDAERATMTEHRRRTKILATLGPATDAPGELDALLAAGVDVV